MRLNKMANSKAKKNMLELPFLPLIPKGTSYNTQAAQSGGAYNSFCVLKNSPFWVLVPFGICDTTGKYQLLSCITSLLHLCWLLRLSVVLTEEKSYFSRDFIRMELLPKLNREQCALPLQDSQPWNCQCSVNFSEQGCIYIWVNLLLSVIFLGVQLYFQIR